MTLSSAGRAEDAGDVSWTSTTDLALEAVTRAARPVTGAVGDYDALIDLVGDRRFVLIGEASHGTHEFYRERARITRRLIDECGFTAVAVEADWPDAYRVNRYVMGLSDDPDGDTALSDFRRFPAWMWRNRDVLQFVEWMRARNDAHAYPATGGNWLKDDPETDSTLGLVLISIEIPDDELTDQPTRDQGLLESQRTNDYYVDAEILNRHLESIQIEL